jgi:hypothetical protein
VLVAVAKPEQFGLEVVESMELVSAEREQLAELDLESGNKVK